MPQSESTTRDGSIDPNSSPISLPNIKLYASLDENNVVEACTGVNYSHKIIEYCDCDELCAHNIPVIGYTFDEELNAFIPPKPDDTYVLNTTTFEWEPPAA